MPLHNARVHMNGERRYVSHTATNAITSDHHWTLRTLAIKVNSGGVKSAAEWNVIIIIIIIGLRHSNDNTYTSAHCNIRLSRWVLSCAWFPFFSIISFKMTGYGYSASALLIWILFEWKNRKPESAFSYVVLCFVDVIFALDFFFVFVKFDCMHTMIHCVTQHISGREVSYYNNNNNNIVDCYIDLVNCMSIPSSFIPFVQYLHHSPLACQCNTSNELSHIGIGLSEGIIILRFSPTSNRTKG